MKEIINKREYIIPGTLIAITALSGLLLSAPRTSADSSAGVTVSVTVPAVCSLTASSDSVSNTIYPGNDGLIGTTNIKAICNDPSGLAVYAVGYTNNTYGNTNLESTVGGTTNTIGTNATASGTPNASEWNMTLTQVSGDYVPTIATGFDSAHAIPSAYAKVAYRDTMTDMGSNATGANFTAAFNAYIANDQAAGTYQGKVKFLLLHPSNAGDNNDGLPIYTSEEIIREEDLPTTAQKEMTGQIDDDGRSIDIYVDYDGEQLHFGDEVRIIGVLHGYDNCVFTLQWQRSADGTNYEDIEGENEFIYKFIVTQENYADYYRILATITAIEIPD